ncbi:S49 family peptidase [Arvimicrobium flavum]|uniref:S49 family peptidase n=1 Tax=Arvimicrobium flavum TaxID=3393320 RepID=UPI00237ABA0F|nr:S49 family peptidase [Mesorhizobium shangrilense]
MEVKELNVGPPTPTIFYDLNMGSAWALAENALDSLMSAGETAFERFARGEFLEPEALEAYRATHLPGTRRIGVRGRDTAIVYLEGTLVKRESWLSQLLGLPTYETVFRDLHVVANNDNIKSIVLYIDSPGGEVHGCGALAEAVYALRGKKPVTAYVSGQACSAAYWIASAAERVVVSDSAMLGSIGVSMTLTDTSKADEKRGIKRFEFVSSNAPNKRPKLDTEAGRSVVQKIVDDLADVFIKSVAKHRRVSTQTVVDKFGQGGVEVGANAVKAGMADNVDQFENVLASAQRRAAPPRAAGSSGRQSHQSTDANEPTAAASAVPHRSPEEVAKMIADHKAAQAAEAARIEAEKKTRIDALWKAAVDRVNEGMGPHAVKSDH